MTSALGPTADTSAPSVTPSGTGPETTPPPRHHVPRRLLLAFAAVVVLAVGGWAGWKYWTVWQYDISTDDAYLHADYVMVAPEVAGYITSVFVGDNQPVTQGDILAVIDRVPYEVAVSQAEAAIAHSHALIRQFTSELDTQPALIAEARGNVAVSEAAVKLAQENVARYGALAEEGADTIQASQVATSQLGQAMGQLALHRAGVIAAQKRPQTLEAELAAAEAALQQNEAALVKARFDLDRTTLRAPMSGIVGNRALRLGLFVQPGTQLLAIVPMNAVYVKANYKETNLAGIEVGMPASIYVDAYPDTPVRGIVNSLSPAAGQTFALLPPDNATGNFTKIVQRVPVKITIDPHDKLAGRLRPGMSVTATVHTRGEKTAVEPFKPLTGRPGLWQPEPDAGAANPDAGSRPAPVTPPTGR